MNTGFHPLRPSFTFKGYSSEQEKKLEEARESHLKQIAALGSLSNDTMETIVDHVLTFGPESHYARQGGIRALKKIAFPATGQVSWQKGLQPEESERCWKILTQLREHPKCANANIELVKFFASCLGGIHPEHYQLSGFEESVEVAYVEGFLQQAQHLTFLVDVLEHHMGIPGSKSIIEKVTKVLSANIEKSADPAKAAQALSDLIQKQPSSKGIPDSLFKLIQTTLYPH